MKRHSIFYLFLFLFCLSGNAANYLISKKATTVGEIITHRGYDFKVGKSAFPDFESFLAANTEDNSIVCVADGTYSKDITITKPNLTFLGNNAYSDWTATRNAETIITANIYIKASNVTINGFKFTEKGRIESTSATNANPLS